MILKKFSFNLPSHLIAQRPLSQRSESRLLVASSKYSSIVHSKIQIVEEFLPEQSVLVINTTRVRRARLNGIDTQTGKVKEILFLQADTPTSWQVLGKSLRVGRHYHFPEEQEAELIAPGLLRFADPLAESYFERHGQLPLPPYIRDHKPEEDSRRYQTVFARETGSVAAPTAGLHFTDAHFRALSWRGITITPLCLHIGYGTFAPIRSENITEHRMHTESYFVPDATARLINKAKQEGRKIIAVGTTSLRVLESAWQDQQLVEGAGETSLFLRPGSSFSVTDALLTNFHMPESSLFILVCAFLGTQRMKEIYAEAVYRGYRFFSYGDACYLERR